VIKSWRIRWVGYVAHVEEVKKYAKFWSEDLKGRDHSEDIGIHGRIILE